MEFDHFISTQIVYLIVGFKRATSSLLWVHVVACLSVPQVLNRWIYMLISVFEL